MGQLFENKKSPAGNGAISNDNHSGGYAPSVSETAYRRVISALRSHGSRVEERGDRAQAQCPAHEDRNPSLSVRRTEGRAHVKCFAGCDDEDVLQTLHLKVADLFDNPRGVQYAYDGGRIVHRTPAKRFFQSGVTTIPELYRLSRVRQAVAEDKTIYLVEGEQDVHTLESLGVVATTAPQGANNVHLCDLTPLHGGKVIAVADRDDQGRKWAEKVQAKLEGQTQSLKVVEAAEGKDVTDHVMAGRELADLAPLTVGEPNDSPDSLDPTGLLAKVKNAAWLDAQDFPELAWTVPGVIPEGFGLLTGPPKIGKSWVTLATCLAVASGGRAFGHIHVGQSRPVLLLALEDGDRRLQARARELLEGAPLPANLDYVTDLHAEEVIPLIAEWLRHTGHLNPLVVLDTLGKVMPPAKVGESTYQRDYRTGSDLKRLADAHPGATVLVVHHTRKATSLDWMDSTSGTNGLNGAADFTVSLTRDRGASVGTLRVTGRDVLEGTYQLTVDGGKWLLDGTNLEEAAQAAETSTQGEGLGDRSQKIIDVVAKHPEGIGPTAVAQILGIEPKHAGEYLRRLATAGRIQQPGRGRYTLGTPAESVESVERGESRHSSTVESEEISKPVSTDSTVSTPPPKALDVLPVFCAVHDQPRIKGVCRACNAGGGADG